VSRIAYFSPLPPNPSGISDYSAVVLPLLARRHHVDLYYDRAWPPSPGFLPGLQRFPHDEYVWRSQISPYDLNLYQMGNSLHHAYMQPLVFHYPGLLILHDLVLHHARGHVLLSEGRQLEYRSELEYCHPKLGRRAGDILAYLPSDFTCYQFPMNKLMVDVSLAVATHTSYGVRELQAASPGRSVHLVHSPRYPDLPVQEDLLNRFRLDDAWPVLASFGFVTPEKRIVACLKAVRKLRARFPRIRYMIVGAHPEHFDPHPIIRRLRLKDVVTVTGRVDEATFGSLLNAATIVLNLRYPTAREMSATLLRALGAGRVTLVSEQIHLTDIPADIAPRVPLFDEDEAIARIVQDLLADEGLLRVRAQRAREFVDSVHGVESVAGEYEAAIAAALEARSLFRPPAGIPGHLRPLASRIRPSLPSGHGIDLMSLFD